jgi:hypothetical protein
VPDGDTRRGTARTRPAAPARRRQPEAGAQAAAPPRKRSGHQDPGPARDPEDRGLVVQRLRYAYATGQLTIGGLRAALATAPSADPAELARLTEGLPPVPPKTGPRGGVHRTYPVDMTLLDLLAEITDPLARAVTAAAKTDAAKADLETARQHRQQALVTAHARYGVPQVRCYDPYGGISARRPFRRDLRQQQANLPTYGDPELNRRAAEIAAEISRLTAAQDNAQSGGLDAIGGQLAELEAELTAIHGKLGDAALAEADAWHARYEAARSAAGTARLVRDREIRALTEGEYGKRVPNAELARLTRNFSSRIAQIRNDPITA